MKRNILDEDGSVATATAIDTAFADPVFLAAIDEPVASPAVTEDHVAGHVVINPGDHGGGDIAAVINAALADPAVTTVELGAGIFMVHSPIMVPSGKTLIGAGEATIIRAAEDFARIPGPGDGVVSTYIDTSDITLQDFTVDANKQLPGGIRLHGVFMHQTTDFTVKGVDVYNATGYAHFAKGEKYGAAPTEYSSGTYEDCWTYNSQTHFEQMYSNGITLTNVHARDGDGDIKSETHFHPLAGSRNITYVDVTSHSLGQGGFSLVSLNNTDPLANITIIRADVEVWAGPALASLGWLSTEGLYIQDSRLVSHTNYGINVGGTTGEISGTQIVGAIIGTLVGKSGNGTGSNLTFLDTHTLGIADPTGTRGANGIAVYASELQWTGGIIEARAGPGLMGPSNVVLNQTGAQLVKNGYEAIAYFVENGPPVLVAPSVVLNGLGDNFEGGSMTARFAFRGRPEDQLALTESGEDGILLSGTEIYHGGVVVGSWSGGTSGVPLVVTFNSAATIEAVQAIVRALSFVHASDNPLALTRTIDIDIVDAAGAESRLNGAVAVSVHNDLPSIDLQLDAGEGSLTYVENSPFIELLPNAIVTDPDSPNFAGGSIRIEFAEGGSVADRLTVLHQGGGLDEITVSGSFLYFRGFSIGSFAGGTDGASPLVLTLNNLATPVAVQALLRAIGYRNVSEMPDVEPRLVRVTVDDGDGGGTSTETLLLNVVETDDPGVNERPRLTMPTADALFTEGGASTPLFEGVLVSDIDAPAHFGGGEISVSLEGGGQIGLDAGSAFRLSEDSDGIATLFHRSTDEAGGELLAPFGTVSGLGTATVSISGFSDLATPELLNALVSSFVFSDTSDDPGAVARSVTLAFSDGGHEGVGEPLTATVTQAIVVTPVNDESVVDLDPIAEGSGRSLTFAENGVTVAIAPDAVLTDPDSHDFDGGTLEVAIVSGGQLGDRLSILTGEGSATNITVQDGDLFYGGTLIGTVAGGDTPEVPLVVTFNALATREAVSTLIRNIGFVHGTDDPSADPRTIGFTIEDGDGGTSQVALASVTITSSEDAALAQDDSATTDEATPIAIDAIGNDLDPDGPTPAVIAIAGQSVTVGQVLVLASGARVILNGDGTLVYDPNGVFNTLPGAGSGASVTSGSDSFTYTLSGGSVATVTVTVRGVASATGDRLTGTAGIDVLTGGFGDDRIEGLKGKDRLDGRGGIDVLVGGDGDDSYFVDDQDVVIEGTGEGFDSVYARTSYALGAGAQVEVLATADFRLTEALHLSGNEFNNAVTGNNGNNLLFGGGAHDSLRGLEGDDVLDGESGRDILFGGIGNDVYFVDDLDRVFELENEGFDIVYARTGFGLSAGSQVEVLAAADGASTTALTLIGNEFNNSIAGNAGNNNLLGGGGQDTLRGYDGHDILDGGTGHDFLVGGLGNDIYIVDELDEIEELTGEGADAAYARTSFTLAAGVDVETLATENFRLTSAINLSGNELNNAITGNNGDNVLAGGGGADTLRGLDGNDILEGGAGRDILIGGAGADIFRFRAGDSDWSVMDAIQDFASGIDRIDLSALDAIPTNSGDDAFTFIGEAAFSRTAGELRVSGSGATRYVEADIDGDGVADFAVAVITGSVPLTAADFIL